MRLAGFTREEYWLFGLEDRSREDARRFLSSARLHNVVAPVVNDWRYRILLEDKWLFARLCDRHGVPAPRTLGLIDRRIGTTWEGGSLRTADDLASALRRTGAERVVIKPRAGLHSEQIVFATIEPGDEMRTRVGGSLLTPTQLLESLETAGFHGVGGHLVQEAVEPHPELAEVNPGALNTVRVHTLRRADGSIQVLQAAARFGRSGSEIEGLDHGGVLAEVSDLERGTLGEGVIRPWLRDGGRYRAHPDSSVDLVGRRLPHWRAALECCRAAAAALPELRLVGWDVAIAASGPMIIEGNPDWSPRAAQSHDRGLLSDEVIAELERLGVRHPHSEPSPGMALRRLRGRLGRSAAQAIYRWSGLDPYADRLP